MGQLTISFDFELGWGAIESKMWYPREVKGVYEDFRPIFKRMDNRLSFASLAQVLNYECTAEFCPNPKLRMKLPSC